MNINLLQTINQVQYYFQNKQTNKGKKNTSINKYVNLIIIANIKLNSMINLRSQFKCFIKKNFIEDPLRTVFFFSNLINSWNICFGEQLN